MSSQKCPSCGLVNWSDSTNCKRCLEPLNVSEADGFSAPPMRDVTQHVTQQRPAPVLGLLMVLWGTLMLGAALYVLSLGSISPVLVGGPAFLLSGILVMRGREVATAIYFLGLVVMSVWLGVTNGPTMGLGSAFLPAIIGLLVTKRRFPILAGFLILLSSLAMLSAVLLPTLLKGEAKVAWRDFRPGQGLFMVRMPSEPVVHSPKIRNTGPLTMTTYSYESRVYGQGSALYVIVDFSLPLSTADVPYSEMLEAELNGMMTRTESTLVSKREVTINGYPGLEFELRPPEKLALKSPRCVGKLFVNSNQIYMMQITATESSQLLAGKDEFLSPVLTWRASK